MSDTTDTMTAFARQGLAMLEKMEQDDVQAQAAD